MGVNLAWDGGKGGVLWTRTSEFSRLDVAGLIVNDRAGEWRSTLLRHEWRCKGLRTPRRALCSLKCGVVSARAQ